MHLCTNSLSEQPPSDPKTFVAVGFASKNTPKGLHWREDVPLAHSDIAHFTRHLHAGIEGIARISKIDVHRSGCRGTIYFLVSCTSMSAFLDKIRQHAEVWDCDLDLSQIPDLDELKQKEIIEV